MRPGLNAAILALYDRAYDRFAADAADADANLLPFVRRLLTYAAAHGPRVEVRFSRVMSDSTEKVDAAVRASAYYMGQVSVPSQYFDDDHARKREAELGASLIEIGRASCRERV